MSRIIKIRAWDKRTKVMLNDMDLQDLLRRDRGGVHEHDLEWMLGTGGQDATGKEIFEGDIINCYRSLHGAWCRIDYQVVYSPSDCGFGTLDIGEMVGLQPTGMLVIHSDTIIGNIYEHPGIKTVYPVKHGIVSTFVG